MFDVVALFIGVIFLILIIWNYIQIIKIRNKVNNNIALSLYAELRDNTATLGKTKAELSLITYFISKINNILIHYNEIRSKGLSGLKLMNNTSFSSTLLGSGVAQITSVYDGYADEFVVSIDKINEECADFFKQNIMIDINLKHSDFNDVLKQNTISAFSKNVKMIIDKFNNTKHLISNDNEIIDSIDYSKKFKLTEIHDFLMNFISDTELDTITLINFDYVKYGNQQDKRQKVNMLIELVSQRNELGKLYNAIRSINENIKL